MSNREEQVGAAVLAVVDRVRNRPNHANGGRRLHRRKARTNLPVVVDALTALTLARRHGSRGRVASFTAAAYLFDRLARRAAQRA
jgi:hypothetical protein